MCEKPMTMFADRLRKAMDSRCVSAADVSRHTNISTAAISHYLSGNYTPKYENMTKLSRFLNIDTEWLIGNDGCFDYSESQYQNDQTLIEKQNERIAQLEEEVAELRLDVQLLKKLMQKS
jgi:transcriptional regulator with XRE-family HTH domain